MKRVLIYMDGMITNILRGAGGTSSVKSALSKKECALRGLSIFVLNKLIVPLFSLFTDL